MALFETAGYLGLCKKYLSRFFPRGCIDHYNTAPYDTTHYD